MSSPRLSFDRGTLLLEGLERARAERLPGVLWDRRTAQLRAPAWRYVDLLGALKQEQVELDDGVRGRFRAATSPWRDVELRAYQHAALAAWRLAGHRGLVVLPTGSGKTRLAVAAMRALAPATVLCLVPTRVLLHQWVKVLSSFYCGAVGCWGDGVRRTEPITVATFESGLRRAAEFGSRFELLVVDEVHHFGDRRGDEALEMCVAPHRLGLTATPPDNPVQRERLTELVGPVRFELAIGDLAGTYLASYDVVVLQAPLSGSERDEYRAEHAVFSRVFRAFRRAAPGAAWSDFIAAASRSDEGRRALVAWRRAKQIAAFPHAKRELLAGLLARHRASRVLVFTPDNASAYRVAREHLVMPLTCEIKRAERDAALEQFRRGELGVLVSSRVLNEGLDVPDADVAIIVGGTQGEREHVQRVGRLLRPAPNKRAVVYELVASGTTETRVSQRRRRALAARTVTAA